MNGLKVCSKNPRYVEFRGKAVPLITSAEHYGAVLNSNFDYIPYLNELSRCGLNLTRIFSGTYAEFKDSHNILNNTCSPATDCLLTPWKRSNHPGHPMGGNKFDLTKWNPDYFRRLKDFLSEASKRDIAVEFVFFCLFYNDDLWKASPFGPDGNINNVGNCDRTKAFDLTETTLLSAQKDFVLKVVEELKDFDNVYYEIMNEPYTYALFEQYSDFHNHITELIVNTEADFSYKHLIAHNYCNRSARIENAHPEVAIFNFHYAEPDAVSANYHLEKVIGDDETGFKDQVNWPYRIEAWQFMLAGGGIFNHLDYSFTVEHPDGTAKIEGSTPGYGGVGWRNQLKVLKTFFDDLELTKVRPYNQAVRNFDVYGNFKCQTLADPGKTYALHITEGKHQSSLDIVLPKGNYKATWINTINGNVDKTEEFSHDCGAYKLRSPEYNTDIALKIIKIEAKAGKSL